MRASLISYSAIAVLALGLGGLNAHADEKNCLWTKPIGACQATIKVDRNTSTILISEGTTRCKTTTVLIDRRETVQHFDTASTEEHYIQFDKTKDVEIKAGECTLAESKWDAIARCMPRVSELSAKCNEVNNARAEQCGKNKACLKANGRNTVQCYHNAVGPLNDCAGFDFARAVEENGRVHFDKTDFWPEQ